MMSTMRWQEVLYPETANGEALRKFVDRWDVRVGAFDPEDRKVLSLVHAGEWERVAAACHAELRNNLGIGRGGDPANKLTHGRLYMVVRRILRPKMVMLYNRHRAIGVTL